MNFTTRRTLALLLLIALVAASGVVYWRWKSRPRGEVGLAPRSGHAVPRSTLAAQPIYLQADPRWASEKLGGSGEPFRSVGCTVCCLSMALAEHGMAISPAQLNQKLSEAGGFTERGWVKWDAVEKISSSRVRVDVLSRPSHEDIDAALARGHPVLVKVLLAPQVYHWVLLVGRDQKDYLMKDPLGDGVTLSPLASLDSDILAVRIVRKR